MLHNIKKPRPAAGPSKSSEQVQKGSARQGNARGRGASAPLGFRLATEPHRGGRFAAPSLGGGRQAASLLIYWRASSRAVAIG